jgi:four helix bundle protein
MKERPLLARTKSFAYRCIRVTEALPKSYLAWHIRKQLIRCASSVAANYRAVHRAQSDAAFIAKLSIVIEEVDECLFWLEMIFDFNLIKQSQLINIRDEAEQLVKIFATIRLNLKNKFKIEKTM